jgi:hypothetical protein
VVNKRIKHARLVQLINRLARQRGLTVTSVPDRGKGSHEHYLVLDHTGSEVSRFVMTGHRRELSWTVLRNIEKALAPLFGEAWMEDK